MEDWQIIGIPLILFVGYTIFAILAGINYSNEIGSYYSLAVDASTAKLKLEYLGTYRERILPYAEGYGGWLIKIPEKNLAEQLKIVDSIIFRLQKVSELDEGSFEYQQALYQISRNDLCHSGEEGVADCYQEDYFRCKYFIENYFISNGVWCV